MEASMSTRELAGVPTAESPEKVESLLQQELEQRHAWATEQRKHHQAAVDAASTIIRACEAGLDAMTLKEAPLGPGDHPVRP